MVTLRLITSNPPAVSSLNPITLGISVIVSAAVVITSVITPESNGGSVVSALPESAVLLVVSVYILTQAALSTCIL